MKAIFLNGASSAGKTTIAHELQSILGETYLHVPVDSFLEMVPDRHWSDDIEWADAAVCIISGYHHSLVALLKAGNNIVIDHVLRESEWLEECIALFADLDVLFVGVHCDVDELERRELARGDRGIGLAKFLAERVHRHDLYDVEVDTTNQTAAECAARIKSALENPEAPHAFARLRSSADGTMV